MYRRSVAIELRRTTSDDPELQALVRALDAELLQRNGAAEQAAYSPHNRIATPTAVVALRDGVAVGCGCFQPLAAGTVELKRMFVIREHRGDRIGRAIVGALEAWARELGFATAVLETGVRHAEALRLYERCGYQVIENYGPYAGMTGSVCMRRELGP